MSFRDEYEAQRERLEAVEEELARAKEELAGRAPTEHRPTGGTDEARSWRPPTTAGDDAERNLPSVSSGWIFAMFAISLLGATVMAHLWGGN